MHRTALSLLAALTLACGGTVQIGEGDPTEAPAEDTELAVDTEPDATPDSDPTPPAGPLRDPSETGPFSIVASSPSPTLSTRTRVPLRVFLPEGDGPFPVVVFTHGFQLTSANYRSYGRHLASWGYVVIMPDLPGSLISAPTHVELADELIALLDWIEASPDALQAKADPGSLGMAGHSMGGKLSLLVATMDERVDAVFGVDPVDAGGNPFFEDPVGYPSVTPERMPDLLVPLGMVGETVNATASLGPACAPREDNFQRYFAAAVSPVVALEIVGANHMSFLDNPSCGLPCLACPAGTDDPARTRALAQRYLTAFFELTLRGVTGYRSHLAGQAVQVEIDAGEVLLQVDNGF
jgi:dienelactone hydrolase